MTNTPIPGDPVYLGSFLANTHWYGVVGDGETPAMQVATMEAVSQDAVICLDALKGDKGDKGDPADIVQMQWDSTITASSQLPTDLNISTDVGKAWWIGNLVYVWTGTHYVAKAMGSPGQPGETPHVTVTMERVAPEAQSTVVQSGTSLNPVMHFKIAAPRGPQGPPRPSPWRRTTTTPCLRRPGRSLPGTRRKTNGSPRTSRRATLACTRCPRRRSPTTPA